MYNTKILHIDSNRGSNYNAFKTAFWYQFDEISIMPDESIIYTFLNASIPYSWYATNEYNSYLDINENGNLRTIQMPYGNYSASDYALTLLAVLNYNNNAVQYTIAYNKINNKYLISCNSTATFLFNSGAHHLTNNAAFMGYTRDADVTINNVPILSGMVTMNDIYNVIIKANICDMDIIKADLTDKIMQIIPVSSKPYAIINYAPNNTIKFKIDTPTLSGMQIELTDDKGNQLNLNNIPYSFNIQIDVIKNPTKITNAREYADKLVTNTQSQPYSIDLLPRIPTTLQQIPMPKPVQIMDTDEYKELMAINKLLEQYKTKYK